jgi:hypothetical protein
MACIPGDTIPLDRGYTTGRHSTNQAAQGTNLQQNSNITSCTEWHHALARTSGEKGAPFYSWETLELGPRPLPSGIGHAHTSIPSPISSSQAKPSTAQRASSGKARLQIPSGATSLASTKHTKKSMLQCSRHRKQQHKRVTHSEVSKELQGALETAPRRGWLTIQTLAAVHGPGSPKRIQVHRNATRRPQTEVRPLWAPAGQSAGTSRSAVRSPQATQTAEDSPALPSAAQLL